MYCQVGYLQKGPRAKKEVGEEVTWVINGEEEEVL